MKKGTFIFAFLLVLLSSALIFGQVHSGPATERGHHGKGQGRVYQGTLSRLYLDWHFRTGDSGCPGGNQGDGSNTGLIQV